MHRFFAGMLARNQYASGRCCDRPPLTYIFLVFFRLQANAVMVPRIPSCYCMLHVQPSRFTYNFSPVGLRFDSESRTSLYWGFTITFRHTTVGRTSLDQWSAQRSDLYLTTQQHPQRQKPMHPAGFEPKISVSDRPQTQALDRAATGIGRFIVTKINPLAFIHLVVSYDRSKASSKASSPHSAIQSFLFQMRVSSPFLKVIQ